MKPISIAPAYVAFYPLLTEIAREHGYALAIHGSVNSDMDLIAVPWVDDAKSVKELIEAISTYASKVMSVMFKDPIVLHGPEHKPFGRMAYTIQIGNGYNIDLSIVNGNIVQLPDFDSLDETQRQKMAIMLFKGTDSQRQEALNILVSS